MFHKFQEPQPTNQPALLNMYKYPSAVEQSCNEEFVFPLCFEQDRQLQHNVTAGVILSNQTLVLQLVTRRNAGNYTCQVRRVPFVYGL